jgi:hypothetical protein
MLLNEQCAELEAKKTKQRNDVHSITSRILFEPGKREVRLRIVGIQYLLFSFCLLECAVL